MALSLCHCTMKPHGVDPAAQQTPSGEAESTETAPSGADTQIGYSEAPRKAMPADKIDTIGDEMGKTLAEALKTHRDSKAWVAQAQIIWPELKAVWQAYAKPLQKDALLAADPEAALVYEFMFGNQDRIYSTLGKLGRAICWGRLDRVWYAMRDFKDRSDMMGWGKCPIDGRSYVADKATVRCPSHGICLTYPDRVCRPNVDKLYQQLVQGEFSHKHYQRLAKYLESDKITSPSPGDRVLDVGCGVGCYTWALHGKVGERGTVTAMDSEDEVLEFVNFVKEQKQCDNMSVLKSNDADPQVRPDSFDAIYMIDIFNSLAGLELLNTNQTTPRTEAYLRKIVNSLTAAGKLVIVDFQPPLPEPHLPAPVTCQYLQNFGLNVVDLRDISENGDGMYILTMSKTRPGSVDGLDASQGNTGNNGENGVNAPVPKQEN